MALVPAPTSKTKGSPDFDDRLDQVGKLFSVKQRNVPVVPCLDALQDQTPYHIGAHAARRPDILLQNLRLHPISNAEAIRRIYIFDDMITTGGHFVASKECLTQAYPHIDVRGFFLAMRIFSPPPK